MKDNKNTLDCQLKEDFEKVLSKFRIKNSDFNIGNWNQNEVMEVMVYIVTLDKTQWRGKIPSVLKAIK